jgi:hypothetical protein
MQVTINQYYPTTDLGEITCVFEVYDKNAMKDRNHPRVVAEFISATHLDESGKQVPLTMAELKALEGGSIYEFFEDDAIEEFFEYINSGEYDRDEKNAAADLKGDMMREEAMWG